MGLKHIGVKDGAAEKLRANHQSSRGYILQMEVWILGRRRGDCTVCSLGLAVAESPDSVFKSFHFLPSLAPFSHFLFKKMHNFNF
jgi:hypothetical protein